MVQGELSENLAGPSDIAWRAGLPVLRSAAVALRELEAGDAASLLAHLGPRSVHRYIATPPLSVDGFKQFIRWARRQRRRGAHLCFGIVPAGETRPIGVIQIWPVESGFGTAEWGFALGKSSWGTGLFAATANLLLDFAFSQLGVIRLETRIVEENGRGVGAMRKLGATREGTLRSGFQRGRTHLDYGMWSILAPEWKMRRSSWCARP